MMTSEEIQENQALYFFLGSRDPCTTKLKEVFDANNGVDIACHLLNTYLDAYSKDLYFVPETKYTLLKVCLFPRTTLLPSLTLIFQGDGTARLRDRWHTP
jgi:hypothetical protein